VEKATYAINISINRSLTTSPYIWKYQKDPELDIDEVNKIKELKVDFEKIKKESARRMIYYDGQIIKG
jgi:uncharacterized Zn finger protein